MLNILTDITDGNGRTEDIALLVEMGTAIKQGSLCALGGSAPNPALTTIRYFRDEYEAHINEKICPAKVCPSLITYHIIPEKCEGCLICKRQCPSDAIAGNKRLIHVIDQDKCIKCGICYEVCPRRFSAVTKVSGEQMETPAEPIPVGSWKKAE
jgi:NADH-quinone oxidoreductase subunit F